MIRVKDQVARKKGANQQQQQRRRHYKTSKESSFPDLMGLAVWTMSEPLSVSVFSFTIPSFSPLINPLSIGFTVQATYLHQLHTFEVSIIESRRFVCTRKSSGAIWGLKRPKYRKKRFLQCLSADIRDCFRCRAVFYCEPSLEIFIINILIFELLLIF